MKLTADGLSIREKLLKTGLELFAEYGYDATSTRMIAKAANVTRSSIAFYFETKESYYNAVIEHALETVHDFLNPLFEEITEAYCKEQITAEKAYEYIFKLIEMQADWFYNDKYATIVKLIIKEQNATVSNDAFYHVLYEKIVELLAKLIMTATGLEHKNRALMLSMMINGSIQSMGEHWNFTSQLFELNDSPEKKEQLVQDVILLTKQNVKAILSSVHSL